MLQDRIEATAHTYPRIPNDGEIHGTPEALAEDLRRCWLAVDAFSTGDKKTLLEL